VKTLNIVALLLTTVVFSFVWADDKMPHSNMTGMHQGSDMINMQDMHNHIRDMETIMGQIHQAKTDKDHWQLMEKHMKEMQSTISMMGPMMNMMGNQSGMMSNEQISKNMMMMDQRMDMMQQMMQHMIDQQSMFMQQRGMMK